MKFCWVTINVKDLSESIRFYEDVIGLPLMSLFPAGPGQEIAFLGDGETQVELICRSGSQDISVGQDISLGFEVPSVDNVMASLKEKGISILAGPFQPNAFMKFFFIQDPNGIKVQFVENR